MLRALLLLLVTCSVLACAPAPVIVVVAEAGAMPDAPGDVPGLEVAADVAVVDATPAEAGADAPEGPPPPDVAVAVDAPRSGELVVRASVYPEARWTLVGARCSASGWGTGAGVAATLELRVVERGLTEPVRVLRATVSPGAVGSLEVEGERVTAGVQTFMGEPYRSAAGERVDFETRAPTRTQGVVTLAVEGCTVGL